MYTKLCNVEKLVLVTSLMLSLFSCNLTHKLNDPVRHVTAADQVWDTTNVKAFEDRLEALRKRHHIPSISFGIVNERKLVLKNALGYADVENKVRPDEHTVYHLASITKTFGSIIIMQQVEAGAVNLDDPIAKYGINLGARWGSDERIKVKHLLTHTAQGHTFNAFRPGYSFRYNGDFYGSLTSVVEKASGKTFEELVIKNIIESLQLKNTVPNLADTSAFNLTGYDRNGFIKNVAKPYDWQKGELVSIQYRDYFGVSAGLMSSVSDLATYSIAIDDNKFLNPGTWEKVFTPAVSPKGKVFQYGLGWFVKYYKGVKVVWHTGWWDGCSGLLIKIPEKDLAFIILANSQDLSRPFYHFLNPFRRSLNNNLRASAFARAFLDHFGEL